MKGVGMEMDKSKIGQLAMKLMDHVEENYEEGAEITDLLILARVRGPNGEYVGRDFVASEGMIKRVALEMLENAHHSIHNNLDVQ
jgi:hypothetical protein